MAVRKFWLVNKYNEKFEDIKECFQFGSPSGLGLSSNLTTVRLGDSSLLTYTEHQLINKSFELRFYGDIITAYQKYTEFTRFIAKSPLYLYYQPPNLKEPLMCEVEIVSLDKGEMDEDKILRCNASFQPLTFWEDKTEHIITATKTVLEGGKHYQLQRPYYYSTSALSNILIYNEGLADAPFSIEVIGEVTDIQYNLYTEDGTKYGVGKINGTFDRIYINSDDLLETIELEKSGALVANPYNYQDLSIGALDGLATTFLKLKSGKNLLTFNVDTNFKGEINIVWRNRYVTI